MQTNQTKYAYKCALYDALNLEKHCKHRLQSTEGGTIVVRGWCHWSRRQQITLYQSWCWRFVQTHNIMTQASTKSKHVCAEGSLPTVSVFNHLLLFIKDLPRPDIIRWQVVFVGDDKEWQTFQNENSSKQQYLLTVQNVLVQRCNWFSVVYRGEWLQAGNESSLWRSPGTDTWSDVYVSTHFQH